LNVEEVAIPFESVVSVSVTDAFENVPLALEDGAVNVTVTPLVGVPFCVTTADSGVGNFVPTSTLCNDPFVAFTANTLDEEEPDELELAQLERATRATIEVVKAKIVKALSPSCSIHLHGIVETAASFRTKPRSLMGPFPYRVRSGLNV